MNAFFRQPDIFSLSSTAQPFSQLILPLSSSSDSSPPVTLPPVRIPLATCSNHHGSCCNQRARAPSLPSLPHPISLSSNSLPSSDLQPARQTGDLHRSRIT